MKTNHLHLNKEISVLRLTKSRKQTKYLLWSLGWRRDSGSFSKLKMMVVGRLGGDCRIGEGVEGKQSLGCLAVGTFKS